MDKKQKILVNILYIVMVLMCIIVVEYGGIKSNFIIFTFLCMSISVKSRIGIYMTCIYYLVFSSRYYIPDLAHLFRYSYGIVLLAIGPFYLRKLLRKQNKEQQNNRFIKSDI